MSQTVMGIFDVVSMKDLLGESAHLDVVASRNLIDVKR